VGHDSCGAVASSSHSQINVRWCWPHSPSSQWAQIGATVRTPLTRRGGRGGNTCPVQASHEECDR
jgi:hypothetical protein